MKSIKKIFAGLLMASAAFGFFGCSTDDSEEDQELVVDFAVSGTTSKTVKMTASSSKMGSSEVYIVYTTNGDEPTVKFEEGKGKADLAGVTSEKDLLALIDYGTADFVKSGESIVLSDSAVVNAKAFYVVATDDKPLKTGPLSTKKVQVDVDVTGKTDSVDNVSGNLNFKLASTGNGFSIHYYDTSAATFTYNGTQHCYYQFQFTTKANGKGNWYLYYRQLGNATPIRVNETTPYIAHGTFTGDALNEKAVKEGELDMKYLNSDGTVGGDFASVNVTEGENSSFALIVTTGAGGKTVIQSAIDANNAK